MFGSARELKRQGIMGMNRRNAEFILPNNKRRLYPLVDNKLKTKRLAEEAGLAVPQLYGVIEVPGDVKNFAKIVENHEDFVVKPANGTGGDGIIVIAGRRGDAYRRSSGAIIGARELAFHIQNTLSGVYSLGGQRDHVMIEYCVHFDPVLKRISYQGVPDIRVLVYRGVPVMAMTRLPTRASDGRANLHQGAVGAGIDMATGRTLAGVHVNNVVTEHPDTLEPIGGVIIPHWDRLLEISARAYELTKLGYFGVDLVLDRDKGPLILEFNARPGLNIQIANRTGLLPRLYLINEVVGHLSGTNERVAFAKTEFSVAE